MTRAIICLSYRRPDLFMRMADSIPADIDAEKILVNNDAIDHATTEAATRRGWRVIPSDRNLSFSEGNNLAVQQATGEHLILLNNDVVLAPGTLDALRDAAEWPIVGVVVHSAGGSITHTGGALRSDLWPHHHCDVPQGSGTGVRQCAWVTFAAVQIRRAVWSAVGGLCEQYHYGYEDVEFCLAAAELGYPTHVALAAEVRHDECSTRVGDGTNGTIWTDRWITTGRLPRLINARAVVAAGVGQVALSA